ncbi:MAG: hypothetical protein JWP89_910 [Schlesneria sp.]|nr:hypothetical protein [Schlesneria sp.]
MPSHVIPAQAGIQRVAGRESTQGNDILCRFAEERMDSRLRGNDRRSSHHAVTNPRCCRDQPERLRLVPSKASPSSAPD